MPTEPILPVTRPPFPTYLLPSLSFPLLPFVTLQRRPSSTASVSSIFSANSPSSVASPVSSANTTPGASPPQPSYFRQRHHCDQLLNGTAAGSEPLDIKDLEESRASRLGRIQPDTLKCSACSTDLAFVAQIISKGFTGRHGRAFLVSAPLASQVLKDNLAGKAKESENVQFRDLINTKVGKPVSRQLVTGAHVVADISCIVCSSVIGWKYVDAKEPAQRYKIGKFILETRRVVGGKVWEDVETTTDISHSGHCNMVSRGERGQRDAEEDEIEFDSEDEDECEDLFAGTWDAEVARKKRESRFYPRTKTSEARDGTAV